MSDGNVVGIRFAEPYQTVLKIRYNNPYHNSDIMMNYPLTNGLEQTQNQILKLTILNEIPAL